MTRILCVDYGRRRVGLAVSDPLGHTAQPLEVIERRKGKSIVDAVLEVARAYAAEEIVVGLPLRLDGTRGTAAEAAQQFASALSERGGVNVALWDERLSSTQAVRGMRGSGVDARRQRGTVDKVAAAVVLQSYLEARGRPEVPVSEAIPPEGKPAPPERPGPEREPGGRAAAKRRAAEKRQQRRSRRRGWDPDEDDDE